MSVRCQRLARFNLLSHNEYFAELNVLLREHRVKWEFPQRTDGPCLPNPSARS
jgi:hypothetical protein